jgi:hypothetical protein
LNPSFSRKAFGCIRAAKCIKGRDKYRTNFLENERVMKIFVVITELNLCHHFGLLGCHALYSGREVATLHTKILSPFSV